MTTIKNLMRRYPVASYFGLTFLFTWGCMLIAAYPGGFPLTEEQPDRTGALVYVAMLVGPVGAGLLLTGITAGRVGFGELVVHLTRWRVGAQWYAFALLTAPLMISTILLALARGSAAFQPAIFSANGQSSGVPAAILVGLVVGLCEELGWTGFAVPRLKRQHGILVTGLIVGSVWGAWHFPLFWERDTFSAVFPLALLMGKLFAWLPPYRLLMVWIYERTESVLVSVIMHASLMASLTVLVPVELSRPDMLTWILAWAAALWAISGAVLLFNGRATITSTAAQEAL